MENQFIIDVETHHCSQLIRRLKRLITTVNVEDGGMYREARNYSQVHLKSVWNWEQLDEWLYLYSNVDYIGCIEIDSI